MVSISNITMDNTTVKDNTKIESKHNQITGSVVTSQNLSTGGNVTYTNTSNNNIFQGSVTIGNSENDNTGFKGGEAKVSYSRQFPVSSNLSVGPEISVGAGRYCKDNDQNLDIYSGAGVRASYNTNLGRNWTLNASANVGAELTNKKFQSSEYQLANDFSVSNGTWQKGQVNAVGSVDVSLNKGNFGVNFGAGKDNCIGNYFKVGASFNF